MRFGADEADQAGKPTCAHVGQRLGGTPIKGSIIGGLGTRVELQACPYAWVHIAFIGETPADYKRLVEVATEREQVIVFDAVADGYIVQNDGTPLLILMSLDEFRQTPWLASVRGEGIAATLTKAPSILGGDASSELPRRYC